MNQFEIPKTFKAAQLVEFGKELKVVELEIPQLQEGQILIKVEAAPLNPYDLLLVNDPDHFGLLQLPAVPGAEGSGVVVQLHESVQSVKVGERVAFQSNLKYGSYGQYAVAYQGQIIHLDDEVTFEEAASSIVNPFTVLLQQFEAKERGAKAVVHTAAASALGKMFVKYFQDSGINVINIVRRDEQIKILEKEGAKYILNSSTPTFFEDLKKLANELDATILFDAIGGPQTGLILQQLPNNSIAFVYGSLSGQDVSNLTAADLLFKGKTVKGFTIFGYLHKYNPFTNVQAQKHLNSLLKTTFKTEYANQYSLEQLNEGIKFYQERQTSRKILIKPWL